MVPPIHQTQFHQNKEDEYFEEVKMMDYSDDDDISEASSSTTRSCGNRNDDDDDDDNDSSIHHSTVIALLKEERDVALLQVKEMKDRLGYIMEAIHILTKQMKQSHYNALMCDTNAADSPHIGMTPSFTSLSVTSTMEEEEEEEDEDDTNPFKEEVLQPQECNNHHHDSNQASSTLGTCSSIDDNIVHDPTTTTSSNDDTPPNSNTTTPITSEQQQQTYCHTTTTSPSISISHSNNFPTIPGYNRHRTHSGISTASSIATYTSKDSKRFSDLVHLSSSTNHHYSSSYSQQQLHYQQDQKDEEHTVDLTKISSYLVALSDACRMVAENASWINDEATASLHELSKANEKYHQLKEKCTKTELCAKRLYKKNKGLRLDIEKEKMDKKILVKEIRALLRQLEMEGQRAKMMRGLELYMLESIMKHELILSDRGNETDWMDVRSAATTPTPTSTPPPATKIIATSKEVPSTKKQNEKNGVNSHTDAPTNGKGRGIKSKFGFLSGALGFHASSSNNNMKKGTCTNTPTNEAIDCDQLLEKPILSKDLSLSETSIHTDSSTSTTLGVQTTTITATHNDDPSLASSTAGLQSYPHHIPPPMTPPRLSTSYDSSGIITPVTPSITDISKSPTFQAMLQNQPSNNNTSITKSVTEDHYLPMLTTTKLSSEGSLVDSNETNELSVRVPLRRKGETISPCSSHHLRCLAIPASESPSSQLPLLYSESKSKDTVEETALTPSSSSLSLPQQKLTHSIENSATLEDAEKRSKHNVSKTIPHIKNNNDGDVTSTTDTITRTSLSSKSQKKTVLGLKKPQTVPEQLSNVVEHTASNTSSSTTTTTTTAATTATKGTSSPATTATTTNSNKKITLGLKVKPRKTKINSFYDLFAYD